MKRGATKEEIIRTTQDLITRNGIRAVRVDEIAQRLGISKRTLYEMFADKNDLISACLDDLARRQRQRIAASRRRRSGNPLQRTLRLANDYIDSLYTVDHSFLADIRRKVLFAEQYDEPVSYTHLDVYKRQPIRRLSRRPKPTWPQPRPAWPPHSSPTTARRSCSPSR